MMKNRTYIGEYHFSDVIVPNGVPAIIPVDIFDRAASRLRSNQRNAAMNKAKERYILTTKLFCGKCKTMMVGECGQKKNGNIYRYYKCAGAKRHECKMKPVRKDLIEEYVIAKTMYALSDEDATQNIIKNILALQEEENTVIPALEAQLREVQKGIENLVHAVEMGVCTRSTKARLEELEAEEEKLLEAIRAEEMQAPKITTEQLEFMFDKYRNIDVRVPENREYIIDHLVGNIILDEDGRITITFCYKNEPYVGTLEEISYAADSLVTDKVGSDTEALASPTKRASTFRGCSFCW